MEPRIPNQTTDPMKNRFKQHVTALAIAALALTGCSPRETGNPTEKAEGFAFIAAADMRMFTGEKYHSSEYFFGTCEAIKAVGKGAFMVGPGDIDPPAQTLETIRLVLGADYPWYPVVGNHELEQQENMDWLREWGARDIPNLVRRGPENGEETTYSFDHQNAHFVVLNEYYDGTSDTGSNGDITAPLLAWLKTDLEENSQPFVFVLGHEPILAIPDHDSGRLRHQYDSLDAHPENNFRFQQLLRKHKVTAYICGHTHNFSYAKINGVWQLDAGHCRGIMDKGAPSTFLKIQVGQNDCRVEVYRDDSNGGAYRLTRTVKLIDTTE